MRYFSIRKDLYLVEQEIPKQSDVVVTPEPINHIWIYDRSYSMSCELARLANDLVDRAKQLPIGDTLTLGWFSSEGQCNFMLKGYRIVDSMDYQILEKVIGKNNSPIGMTCFSEILAETSTVVEDLSVISSNFALCFFTDGYPVVSSYAKERKNIQTAIEAVEGRISASLLVGYGNYYNKELMTQMAEWFGGSLVHSDDLMSFSITLTEFMSGARDCSPKQTIRLEFEPKGPVFSISGKNVNVYEDKSGHVNFVPSKRAKNYLYAITSEIPDGAKQVSFQDKNVTGKSTVEPVVKAAYALAYIYTQRTKTDDALQVLGLLGDKTILDSVCNAFTNDEYGSAESKMIEAMSRPSKRFASGRSTSYLPAEDAHCLLDALHLLQTDKDAYFYPRHKQFKYSRIGVASAQEDDGLKFAADPDTRCSMHSLTWNAKKLNLSVLANIPGTIELGEGHDTLGFQKNFPTHVYRNYALVKDGFLNVKEIPVSLGQSAFTALKAEGVIDSASDWGSASEIHMLHLDRIPVVNRIMAKGRTSAADLCKKTWQEWEYKGKIKALKSLMDKEIPQDAMPSPFDGLSETQQEFLTRHCITKNGFSPKVEKVEPSDFYFAKEFEIKVKGVSSLPKLDKVLDKRKAGKSLTLSESLVGAGVDIYERTGIGEEKNTKVKVIRFQTQLEQLNEELRRVRKDIQETKFAVLLGKAWFDEFTSREDNTLEVDGHLFTVSLREVKVAV